MYLGEYRASKRDLKRLAELASRMPPRELEEGGEEEEEEEEEAMDDVIVVISSSSEADVDTGSVCAKRNSQKASSASSLQSASRASPPVPQKDVEIQDSSKPKSPQSSEEIGDHVGILAATAKRKQEFRFAIRASGVIFGRGKLLLDRAPQDKKLTVPDPEISRKHLRLWLDDSCKLWHVQDLGSLNGSSLNGKTLSKDDPATPVSLGDKLVLGSWRFTLEECRCRDCLPTCVEKGEPQSPTSSTENSAKRANDKRSESGNNKNIIEDGEQIKPPSLGRCLACATDLSLMSLEHQNQHMYACMEKNKVIDNLALHTDAPKTARKRRAPSGGKAARESLLATSTVLSVQKTTIRKGASKQIKPLLLSSSIPQSVAEVSKRMDLVDARIHELQAYRLKLAAYLTDAQTLQDALLDSGSDTAMESDHLVNASDSSELKLFMDINENSRRDVGLAAALSSSPVPPFSKFLSSSSSDESIVIERPITLKKRTPAQLRQRQQNVDKSLIDLLDSDDKSTGSERDEANAKEISSSGDQLKPIASAQNDAEEEEEEEEEEYDDIVANLCGPSTATKDGLTPGNTKKKNSIWAITKQCSASPMLSSPSRFRTSLLDISSSSIDITPIQPRKEASTAPFSSSSTSSATPELAVISRRDLQRSLAEAGVATEGTSSRTDLERDFRQMIGQAQSKTTASNDSTTITQASLDGLTGPAKEQALNMAICEAITQTMRNERIYEDMLMNKCVHLAAVQAALKDSGIKVPRVRLAHFLDHHGVTFKP